MEFCSTKFTTNVMSNGGTRVEIKIDQFFAPKYLVEPSFHIQGGDKEIWWKFCSTKLEFCSTKFTTNVINNGGTRVEIKIDQFFASKYLVEPSFYIQGGAMEIWWKFCTTKLKLCTTKFTTNVYVVHHLGTRGESETEHFFVR